MQIKQILTAVLLIFVAGSLVFLLLSESGNTKIEKPSEPPSDTALSDDASVSGESSDPIEKLDRRLIAYYFHGDTRCPTCLKIEAYSKEALTQSASSELDSGTFEWHAVNTDKVWNSHFLTDFNLSFSSLVIADVSGAETLSWKNLEKVWELVGDKEAFFGYVRSEAESFLEAL